MQAGKGGDALLARTRGQERPQPTRGGEPAGEESADRRQRVG